MPVPSIASRARRTAPRAEASSTPESVTGRPRASAIMRGQVGGPRGAPAGGTARRGAGGRHGAAEGAGHYAGPGRRAQEAAAGRYDLLVAGRGFFQDLGDKGEAVSDGLHGGRQELDRRVAHGEAREGAGGRV